MVIRKAPLLMLFIGLHVQAELIFSDNFDQHPDWMNAGKQTLGTLPVGWDSARVDEEWHPATEPGTQPAMQINGHDPEKVYGGTGKSLIMYAESFDAKDDNGWSSDGQLTKDLSGHDELYVKFNIKFSSDFARDLNFGTSKIFRLAHWDGQVSRYKFFSDGNSGPIYIWNWYLNSYGARNQNAFRCADPATNYYCTNPSILNPPRQVVTGDMNANFTDNVAHLAPKIPDLVNGGFLPYSGIVSHDQVWSDAWHSLEFYVKTNSAPGAQDGVLTQWLDGQKIIHMTQIPWIGAEGGADRKWNIMSIGGNDHHHTDLTGDPMNREYWYAIDNIEIHDSIPKSLAKAPENFSAGTGTN